MTNSHEAGARPGRPLLWLPVQTAVVVALGLLVTGPLAHRWPLSAEDGVNRALAARRTPFATALTDGASLLAGTESVIVLTLMCAAVLLLVPHAPRWREAAFLAVAVAAQSAVFLLVTLVVNRERPDVPHLDPAPPTSSFPSGHVGASVALFGGLAVLASRRLHGVRRHLVTGLLLAVPLFVAFSRVYRGMHHTSDVVAGLLNGACTLAFVAAALLPRPAEEAPPAPAPSAHSTRRAVVVRHPRACGDGAAARVRALLRDHGYTEQRWTETTAGDPSGALASCLGGRHPELVVVCGGDGTVRACADVVAGTGIPLAIVPCGTGNLLARNLRLPTDPVAALREALRGQAVGLDVGRIRGDGIAPTRFAVMAGAGFDAAMVRDASARLKERLGWAAYVVSAVRHLGDARMRLSIRLDGGAPLERRARMVVIGNVGTLQGGLPLLPDARPDSGRLEVVLLDPRGVAGWLAAAGYLASRAPGGRRQRASGAGTRSLAHGSLEYFGAARIDLRFARPQPRELDGDVLPAGTRLTAEVEPGALRVCLPAPAEAGAPAGAGIPTRVGAPAGADAPAGAVPPTPEDTPTRAGTPARSDVPARAGGEGGGHGHRDPRTAAQ
ncbi:diacylglycerol kinase family protein [Streptomyces globisporus]|uniref:diacylglycerol kinase family protein n=1 Tax=Streptomyces globisporus TaxID=1908 RepID=UPI00099B46FA|nr:diacylglycerol kinase family protein [Streptomyces globisporus]